MNITSCISWLNNKNNCNKNSLLLINKKITALGLILITAAISSYGVSAVEIGAKYLKGSDSDSDGFEISLSQPFSRKSSWFWNLSYNKLNDVVVDWNESELTFPVENVDAYLSYRFTPHSYNPNAIGLSYEFLAGAAISVKENKFEWASLNEEKYFSEKNDINFLVGSNIIYKFSRSTAVNVGIKYYPSYSEFDSISAVNIGFTYKFGSNRYGNKQQY